MRYAATPSCGDTPQRPVVLGTMGDICIPEGCAANDVEACNGLEFVSEVDQNIEDMGVVASFVKMVAIVTISSADGIVKLSANSKMLIDFVCCANA